MFAEIFSQIQTTSYNPFCNECRFLSITEKEQDKLKEKPDHICEKYDVKLVHLQFHPKILKCHECLDHTTDIHF